MKKLAREELYTLEKYSEVRPEFKTKVIAHKKDRQITLDNHATLYFEDRLTIQYQIQEMLRVERIFEATGIAEELDAYNPLIPDGSNLKATFMIEYEDEAERKRRLAELIGIEDRVWVRVDDMDKVFAIADEDLDRENEDKTSSVHFLRFELDTDMARALKAGTALAIGIDHPNYQAAADPVADNIRKALAADID